MGDLIDRQVAIDDLHGKDPSQLWDTADIEVWINELSSAQPDSFVDADKLKRCRFEYINACKIVAHPTKDTSKSDIYDAHAVIKALHPIFGDMEF